MINNKNINNKNSKNSGKHRVVLTQLMIALALLLFLQIITAQVPDNETGINRSTLDEGNQSSIHQDEKILNETLADGTENATNTSFSSDRDFTESADNDNNASNQTEAESFPAYDSSNDQQPLDHVHNKTNITRSEDHNLSTASIILEETLKQLPAEIGKPVTWKKTLVNSKRIPLSSITDSVPGDAFNFRIENLDTIESLNIIKADPTTMNLLLTIKDPLQPNYSYQYDTPPPVLDQEIERDGKSIQSIIHLSTGHSLPYADVFVRLAIPDALPDSIRLFSCNENCNNQIQIDSDPAYALSLLDFNGNSLIEEVSFTVPQVDSEKFLLEYEIQDLPEDRMLIHEHPNGVGILKDVHIRLIVYNNNSGDMPQTQLKESIPRGWTLNKYPSDIASTVTGNKSTGTNITFTLPALSTDQLLVLEYTTRSPDVEQEYQFSTVLGNKDPLVSLIDVNGSLAFFESTITTQLDNFTDDTRTIGTKGSYPALITIKNIGIEQNTYPTFMYWVYDPTKWQIIERFTGNDCKKSKIVLYGNKQALQCEWQKFDEDETKSFYVWLTGLENSTEELTFFNITYDPPQGASDNTHESQGLLVTTGYSLKQAFSLFSGFFSQLLFSGDFDTLTGDAVHDQDFTAEAPATSPLMSNSSSTLQEQPKEDKEAVQGDDSIIQSIPSPLTSPPLTSPPLNSPPLNSPKKASQESKSIPLKKTARHSVLSRMGTSLKGIFSTIVQFFRDLFSSGDIGSITGDVIKNRINTDEKPPAEEAQDQGADTVIETTPVTPPVDTSDTATEPDKIPTEKPSTNKKTKKETYTAPASPPASNKRGGGSKGEPPRSTPPDQPSKKLPEPTKIWHSTKELSFLRSRSSLVGYQGSMPVPAYVRNAKGQPIAMQVKKIIQRKETQYELDLDLDVKHIRSIKFDSITLEPGADFTLGIDDLSYENLPIIGNAKAVNAFAIDPSALNFTNATLTYSATGKELYKCVEWNFTTRHCYGSWIKVMETVPGKDYIILFNATDPGYAETGIATVNTKKPMYHPGETAEIIMVVLDTDGYLVRNADVYLTVTDPNGLNTTYSTLVNTVNQQSAGIYIANHTATNFTGNYTLKVHAEASKVNSTLETNFVVKDFYEFGIIRDTPVTIDPWRGPFDSFIEISTFLSVGSFSFTEVLPSNLTVIYSGGGMVTYGEEHTNITWTGLHNNSVVGYSARAPYVTPDLYALGPAVIIYPGGIFYEARPWYLAIDPLQAEYDPDSTVQSAWNQGTGTTYLEVDDGYRYPSNPGTGTSVASKANAGQVSEFGFPPITVGTVYNMTLWVYTATGSNAQYYFYLSQSGTADRCTEFVEVGVGESWRKCDWTTPSGDYSDMRIRLGAVDKNGRGAATPATVYEAYLQVVYQEPAPAWSNNATSIVSEYSPTQSSYFNITWTTDAGVSSAWFESNITGEPTNTSMSYLISDIYSYTAILPAGTFTWKSYANNSIDIWNQSDSWVFTIAKANPSLTLMLGSTEGNVTIDEDTSIWINGTLNSGDAQAIQLFRNGTKINDKLSPVKNLTLFAEPDYVNITLIYSESGNYTGKWITYYVNVTDNTAPTVNLFGPPDASFDPDGDIYFIYNVSDFSEIDHCELLYSGVSVDTNDTINKSNTHQFVDTDLAQGTYTWRVNCTDSIGLEGTSELRSFTVDKTNPGVTLQFPSDTNWNTSNTISFRYTPSDTYLEACVLYHNKSGWQKNETRTGLSSGSPDTVTIQLEDGHYVWNVECNDSSGRTGWNSQNRTLYVDTQPPSLSYTAPTPGDGFNQSITTFVINVTHTESNPHTLILSWNGVNESRDYSGSYSNITKNDLQGIYSYWVWINDSAGQAQATSPQTVTIDSAGPVVELELPNPDDWVNSNTVTFWYNVTDTIIGTDNCTLIIDERINQTNESVTEGTSQSITSYLDNSLGYTWQMNCTDMLGNENTSLTRTVKVDTTFPTISNEAINGTTFGILTEICLNVTVSDTFSDVSSVKILVDYPESPTANISLSNTTGGCGGAGGNTWSYSFYNEEQGTYNWTATFAEDTAGNINMTVPSTDLSWSVSATNEMNATMLAPVTDIEINESESNNQYTQKCNVTCNSGTCSDVTLMAQYNNDSWNDATTATTQLANSDDNYDCGTLGTHAYCVYTFTITSGANSGGNTWPIRCAASSSDAPNAYSDPVNLVINDHPLAAWTYPASGAWLAGIKILNGSSSADDQGIDIYHFEIDGSIDFSSADTLCTSGNSNCTFNTSAQVQCADSSPACYLRLSLTDSDDLTNSTIIQIGIDNTYPTLSLDSPSDGMWSNTANNNLAYTPSDTNLETCTLYHNASGWTAQETNASVESGSQDIFAKTFSDGAYLWNVVCNDSAGNTRFNKTNRTLYVDTKYPTITFSGETENNNTSFARDWVYLEVTANDPNEANITFTLYNSVGTIINTTTRAAGTRNVNFTNLADTDEEYYYNVTIRDKAGNTNSTKTQLIILDNTVPLIDFGSGTRNDNAYSSTDWIYVDTSSTETNFKNITFYVYTSEGNLINATTYTTSISLINFTNLADTNRPYAYNVTIRDRAGLINSTSTRTITLDTALPVVQLNEPPNGTELPYSVTEFNYTPSDTNLANCSLWADFSGSWEQNQTHTSPVNGSKNTFSSVNLSDAAYVWNVECTDKAGNTAFNSTNYTFEIYTSPPAHFDLLSPANDTYSQDLTPLLEWEATQDDHFDNYTILFDDSADFLSNEHRYYVYNNISNTSYQINPGELLTDNTYFYWKVIAYNDLGWSTSSNSTFVYVTDNSLPAVYLESPENNTPITSSTTVTFSFNVSDNYNAKNCSLIVDGSVAGTDTVVTLNTSESLIATLSQGQHNWSVNCTDRAGNTNASGTYNLSIQVNIPYLTFYETSAGGGTATTPEAINLSSAPEANANRVSIGLSNVYKGYATLSVATLINASNFGPQGLLIPESSTVDFSGNFQASRNTDGYAVWKLEYETGGVYELCRDQTLSYVTSVEATMTGSCTTPAQNIFLSPSDELRLTAYGNKTGSKTLTFHHDWDNPDDSGFSLYAYPLGNLQVNLSSPLSSTTINQSSKLNVTCNASCSQGWCFDVAFYIQQNTSTLGWRDINDSSGPLTLFDDSNGKAAGSFNSTGSANFTLKGNSISTDTNIRCRSVSAYHNTTGSRTTAITIRDWQYPRVSLHAPLNDSWDNDGNVLMYYTPQDNYAISNCSLIIDEKINQTNNTITLSIQNNFTVSGLEDGGHNWSVNCTDTFGNRNSSVSWMITIDSILPDITYAGGTLQDGSFRDHNWIYVDITASDDNEANITFNLYNSSYNLINTTTRTAGTRNINFTNIADTDEQYYYNVTITDKAMNQNTTSTWSIILDSTHPEISFAGGNADNNSYHSRDWIYVNITASDDNEANITFNLYNSSYNLINTTTRTAGTRNINFTNIADTNEQYYYNVTITDKASHTTTTGLLSIILDTVYPQLSYGNGTEENGSVYNRNWIYVNVTSTETNYANITFRLFNSSYSLINSTTYSADISFINFTNLQNTNQHYHYNVTVIDKAGNKNTTASRTIVLDSEAPSVSLDNPQHTSWSATHSVSFYYTPADKNLDDCVLYHNASGTFEKNATNNNPTTEVQQNVDIILPEGTILWNVWCNDSALNSAFNTSNRTINIDTTFPLITYAGGTLSNGSHASRDWIYVNVSLTEMHFSNITFRLYNSSRNLINKTTYSTKTVFINFTNLGDTNEIYYYNVTVTDSAHNVNTTDVRALILDTTAPQISFSGGTAPNNSYYHRDWIFMNISAYDQYEANVTFTLYDQNLNEVNQSTLAANTRSVNFTDLTDTNERYSYNVSIRDKAGNMNTTELRIITLDSLNPTVTYVYPTPDNNSNQSSTTITVNVTHSETNPDTIAYYFDEAINSTHEYDGSYTNFTVAGITDGIHTLYIWLNDSAGNTNQTVVRTIRIDTTPPNVTSIIPDDNVWKNSNSNTVEFQYNVSDGLLSIAHCSILIDGIVNSSNQSVEQNTAQTFDVTLSEGSIQWNIRCQDQVGNVNESNNRTIKTDLTSPTISQWGINDTNLTITEHICLNATASDALSGVNAVWATIIPPNKIPETILLSNSTTTPCDTSDTDNVFSAEYQLLQVGEYNWSRVYTNDTAGNIANETSFYLWNSTSIGTITVNLTAPSANIEVNESETFKNYTYQHTCEAVCDDKPQNCTDVTLYAQYNLTGATDITTSTTHLINYNDSYFCGNLTAGGTGCSHTFTIRTGTTSGPADWKVWCRAESTIVGSYISNERINISINDHPQAEWSYPSDGEWVKGTIMLNGSSSTDDQNVVNYLFELDNNTDFDTSSVLCDSSDEICQLFTAFQTQCDDSSTDCYLRLNVTDSDGLKNSTTIQFGIDNTAPTLALDQPPTGENITTATYTTNASATDEGVGVNTTVFEFRENASATWTNICSDINGPPYVCVWNVSSLTEGNDYQVRAYANDGLGTTSSIDTHQTIRIDTQAPTINLVSPANSSWHLSNITFSYNVSDTISQVLNCSLIMDGRINVTNASITQDQTLNFTINGLAEGSHNWSVNCTDYFLHVGSSETEIVRVDLSGPTSILDRPTNFTYITTSSYMINATTVDGGVGENASIFQYRPSPSDSWTTICTNVSQPYHCSWSTSGLSDGNQYQVRVYGNDSLGNIGSPDTHANITVDWTAPTVSLVSPQNRTRYVWGNITFYYNVTDVTSPIANCSLNLNGTINQTNTSITKNVRQNFTVTNIPFGNYSWSVACTDYTGNANTSETYTLNNFPDSDEPVVSLVSPGNNKIYTSENVIFKYNVTDLLSAISNCSLIFNGSLNQTNYEIEKNVTQSFSIPNVADGNYTWSVNCTDASSGYYNRGSSDTWNISVYKTTNIVTTATTDQQQYEQGEDANITVETKTQFGAGLVTNITLSIIKGNTSTPWYNTSFPLRKQINVTNIATMTMQTGHTINITLDTESLVSAGKMQDNGNDLRIAYFNNVTNNWSRLHRTIIAMNTTATTVLFPAQQNITPGKSDTYYYMYYGNLSVSQPPDNKSKVFFYYDGFEEDSLSAYNTTRGLHDASEDDDSTLEHVVDGGFINYSGTSSKGKSIRLLTPAVKHAVVEVDQYVEQMLGAPPSAKMEVAARMNSTDYYSFYASTNIFDSKLFRHNSTASKELDTVNTQFTDTGVWHHLKFIVYDNTTTVFLKAYVDGTLLFSYNDSSTSQIMTAGGFAIGSYQLVGRWDNVTVKRYLEQEPITVLQEEEVLVAFDFNQTNEDGISVIAYDTLNLSFDNYSAVVLARHPDYFNGAGGTQFEVIPDISPPRFYTVQLSHDPPYNFIDLNITSLIQDRARSISTVYLEGNWSGQARNISASSINGTLFTFGISHLNLSGGEYVEYKFHANDTLGNYNVSNIYNFTVRLPKAIADVSYPLYEISRYTNRSFWVNASITAINGSTGDCNVTVGYPSEFSLHSSRTQDIANLTNGSTSTAAAFKLNSSTSGAYYVNITTACKEGIGTKKIIGPIEYVPIFTNVTSKLFSELVTVNGNDLYHLSTETEVDWWINLTETAVNLNSSAIVQKWFGTTWYLIINDTTIYSLPDFSWDILKTTANTTLNESVFSAVGRLSNPSLRINLTNKIVPWSKSGNISFSVENIGSTAVQDVKLRWVVRDLDIGVNDITDNVTFVNGNGQTENHVGDSTTTLSYNSSDFDTDSTATIYFTDRATPLKGYIYWEWNMSKDGATSGYDDFSFTTGMNGADFQVNVTFGFGSLGVGSTAGFDPGEGIFTPDYIRRTTRISSYNADESGTTYTDVTVPLTDNDYGSTDYINARNIDTVEILNIINATETTGWDYIGLVLYPTALEADPYDILVMSYNDDNVTVDSSIIANFTVTSSHLNQYITINITNLAHLQDSNGYIRIRLSPNASTINNNKKMTIAEVRFNFTDDTSPEITLHDPIADYNTTSQSLMFNFSAGDAVDDPVTCNLTIDGGVEEENLIVYNGTPYTVTTAVSEGTHIWNVTCWDQSSNMGTSSNSNFTVVGPPTGLSVYFEPDNNSLKINWTPKTYADSYFIFISENFTSFSSSPNVTSITTNNWTDTTAENYTQRYYKIGVTRGAVNATSTEIAGKYVMEILDGFNLVSSPLDLTSKQLGTLSSYPDPLPTNPSEAINSIYQFNVSNEAFLKADYLAGTGWQQATGSEDFTALNSTMGYWIDANQAANLTFLGRVPLENTTAPLEVEWTVVSWLSLQTPTLPTGGEPPAYPIEVSPANAITRIYSYDAEADLFNKTDHYNGWGWWPATGSDGFTHLQPTKGYYFKALQSATWTVESYKT